MSHGKDISQEVKEVFVEKTRGENNYKKNVEPNPYA